MGRRVSAWRLTWAIAAGVALGHFFGRMGSELAWGFMLSLLRWHGWPH